MADLLPPIDPPPQEPEETSTNSRKRKRQAPLPVDPQAALSSDQLQKKFFHLNKALLAAAKKAQKLEIQKLNKSKKNLKATAEDQTSLSSQLTDLKALALEPLIALNLHTRLSKIHLLDVHPSLHPLVVPPPSPHDGLKSKAANRVLSSKAFAAEMAGAVGRVKGWVDPEFRLAERAKESAEKRAVEAASISASASVSVGEGKGRGKGLDEINGREGEVEDGDEVPPVRARSPELVPEVDGVDYDDSRSEGGEYSGSEDEDSDDDDPPAGAISESSSSDSDRPSTKPVKKPKVEKKASEPAKKKKIASSTFLPSLSAGYTFGGSDSEPEELSDDGGVRKNRRGQRARKAIWEKKYGANANHLKAARANGEDTSLESNSYPSSRGRGGSGASRGGARGGSSTRGGWRDFSVPTSTDGGYHSGAGGRGGLFVGRGGFSSGSTARPTPSSSAAVAPKKAEGAMHPSWVAKQKLKEREKALADVRAAGQPKKIVFD